MNSFIQDLGDNFLGPHYVNSFFFFFFLFMLVLTHLCIIFYHGGLLHTSKRQIFCRGCWEARTPRHLSRDRKWVIFLVGSGCASVGSPREGLHENKQHSSIVWRGISGFQAAFPASSQSEGIPPSTRWPGFSGAGSGGVPLSPSHVSYPCESWEKGPDLEPGGWLEKVRSWLERTVETTSSK